MVAAMGHEVLGTSRNLLDYIDRLSKRINEIYAVADERVLSHTTKIRQYGHILYSVANFALSHIDRDKRTRQKIKVNKVIKDLYDETLDEICKTNSASLTLKLGKTPDTICSLRNRIDNNQLCYKLNCSIPSRQNTY